MASCERRGQKRPLWNKVWRISAAIQLGVDIKETAEEGLQFTLSRI